MTVLDIHASLLQTWSFTELKGESGGASWLSFDRDDIPPTEVAHSLHQSRVARSRHDGNWLRSLSGIRNDVCLAC